MRKSKILMITSILSLLLFGSGITYSLFQSDTNMSSVDQNIAKFIFNTENLNELELPLIDLKPGDSNEYQFAITNSKAGILSNVSVEYQLTIKTYHFVPLTIDLYRLEGSVEELILSCDETYTRNSDNELICNSSVQTMGHDASMLDNYIIKLAFPSDYNDSLYAGLVDYINVEIKSWQKIEE